MGVAYFLAQLIERFLRILSPVAGDEHRRTVRRAVRMAHDKPRRRLALRILASRIQNTAM